MRHASLDNDLTSSPSTRSVRTNGSQVGEDSDDDFDWEEVAVPDGNQQDVGLSIDLGVNEGPSTPTKHNIEITLLARPKKDDTEK